MVKLDIVKNLLYTKFFIPINLVRMFAWVDSRDQSLH